MKNILLIITLTMTSCLMQDGFKHNYNVFDVNAGEHVFKEDKVGLHIKQGFKTEGKITFGAYFENNCLYSQDYSGDINKLFGLSDNSHHHKNSARFGWRSAGDSIEIFAYSYSDGKRYFESMGYTKPYEREIYRIDLRGSVYKFTFKDAYVELPRDKNRNKGVFYRLFPYFGGNKPAPHSMSIWIREY